MNKFKARVIIALIFMKEFAKTALVFVIPIFLAVVCLEASESVMNGYYDCSRELYIFSRPHGPTNCANDRTLLARDVFWFLGIVLIIAPLAAALIFEWRKAQAKEIKIESIKISEL